MAGKKESREEFIKVFIGRIIKRMIDGGMVESRVYPDIEKIKENIKIYESPESTFANAIIMNQSPEIQKLMNPSFNESGTQEVKQTGERIESIMKAQIENQILPMPMPIKNIQKPVVKPRSPFEAPFSQPMPFMHQKAGVRMLQTNSKPSIIMSGMVPSMQSSSAPEKESLLGVERLDRILKDPGVQTLECPGPNKQILIYKSGVIQTANVSLTLDEINNIMKEISEKTRIPLMSGVFKATQGNLTVTAVVSEFVGTRFIVQKKSFPNPQMQSNQYG